MSKSSCFLLSRVLLNLEARASDIVSALSAAAFSSDGNLWLGSDKTIGIQRLFPLDAIYL